MFYEKYEEIKERVLDFWEENKIQIIIFTVGVILTFSYFNSKQNENNVELADTSTVISSVSIQTSSFKNEASQNKKEVYIDIKGAVNKPGLYHVKPSQRLGNVLNLAGGLKENADVSKLNLAHTLSDQMMIYIPKQGENYQGDLIIEAKTNIGDENTNSDSDLVDLNSASKDELQTLTGIGEKKAELIIQYREDNGGFKTVDDLKNVSGIGDKTFANLSSKITV